MYGQLTKWSGRLLLLSLMSAGIGCTTVGPATNDCSWVKPIYVSKADVLTDGTVEAILRHNETWKAICDK